MCTMVYKFESTTAICKWTEVLKGGRKVHVKINLQIPSLLIINKTLCRLFFEL